ncbi:DUF4870 domain-containing protein [Parafrigoribacterium humi]|jgi:uncharacterized Tic20 family protein|uniref:DUF4870 domain-containing protein n=1 Tax=Parafrigoribacterium humi TaxID=3144664 RepID=UPI0032EEC16C
MTDQTPQPAAPQPAAPLTAADDKLWASLAHFGGILWILPSLIIFLVFKDRGERTRVEGKEALNWQITFLIIWIAWLIISSILLIPFVIVGLGWLLTLIGFLIYIANVVFSVLGGVKVQQGGSYRYPFSFRFIK